MRAAFDLRREFGQHSQTRERALAVNALDAETKRLDPFERLLFPFDGQAVKRETHFATRVSSSFVFADLDARHARVAVESIRVGDERPKFFGTRFEIKLPAFVILAKGHVSIIHRLRRNL